MREVAKARQEENDQMSRITICTAFGSNRPLLTKIWRSPAEKPKP